MKYSTHKGEKIVLAVVITALLAMIGAWIALEKAEAQKGWQPEGSYPMVNANISWQQTFHSGAWN